MTLREIRLDLTGRLKSVEAPKLLDEIGRDLLLFSGVRIFEDGLKSDGGKIISGYSNKPMYAPVRASAKLRPAKGKTGKTKFKSGKAHKSRYLKGGYKELKSKVGRELPLELTGQLKASYQAFSPLTSRNFDPQKEGGGSGNPELLMGFQDVKRITFTKESTDLTNDELRIHLEKKYGVFTALSKEEEKLIDKITERFINSKL